MSVPILRPGFISLIAKSWAFRTILPDSHEFFYFDTLLINTTTTTAPAAAAAAATVDWTLPMSVVGIALTLLSVIARVLEKKIVSHHERLSAYEVELNLFKMWKVS